MGISRNAELYFIIKTVFPLLSFFFVIDVIDGRSLNDLIIHDLIAD